MNNKIDLEYAKKFKELGVKQESEFYYIAPKESTSYELVSIERIRLYREIYTKGVAKISAFTVGELGEMLPYDFSVPYKYEKIDLTSNVYMECRITCWIDSSRTPRLYGINIESQYEARMIFKDVYDKSEANVRAKMLIYLIENKLVGIPK